MSVKQPKLVLRESCIDDLTRGWSPGSLLDVGAGTGHMSRRFIERGFEATCFEIDESGRSAIRRNLASHDAGFRVIDRLEALEAESVDTLMAIEVLEHIDKDYEALVHWARYLRRRGRLLISVPAHARKFGRSDELVGHVRRYEKQQLHDLLQRAGFSDIRIVSYGFPITEITRPISNYLIKPDKSCEDLSPEQRSIRSAQAKSKAIERVLSIVGSAWVKPFCVTQRWFYDTDLGDGYAATATKIG